MWVNEIILPTDLRIPLLYVLFIYHSCLLNTCLFLWHRQAIRIDKGVIGRLADLSSFLLQNHPVLTRKDHSWRDGRENPCWLSPFPETAGLPSSIASISRQWVFALQFSKEKTETKGSNVSYPRSHSPWEIGLWPAAYTTGSLWSFCFRCVTVDR